MKDNSYVEFDVMGIYTNFEDGLETNKDMLDKACKEFNIDISQICIVYSYPSFIELQKYGQISQYDNARWLESLGTYRTNYFRNLKDKEQDFENLRQCLLCTRSIAMFLGTRDLFLSREFEELKFKKIPIIECIPDEIIVPRWVGEMDHRPPLPDEMPG